MHVLKTFLGGLVGLAGLVGYTPEVLAITPTLSIEGAGRGGLELINYKENPSNYFQTLAGVSVAGSSLCCRKHL